VKRVTEIHKEGTFYKIAQSLSRNEVSIYFNPMVEVQSIAISVSVCVSDCLSVGLSARISQQELIRR